MEFRLAKEIDKEKIEKIYEDGSEKLKSLRIDKWQGEDKPNLNNFSNLIKNKNIYVLEDNGKIVSTVIIYKFDYDYENNLDSSWTSNGSYVAFHRIGTLSAECEKGYGRKIIEFAEKFARENNFNSVRIDTHRKNIKMQNLLKNLHYKYVGLVYLNGKNERLAFEKLI